MQANQYIYNKVTVKTQKSGDVFHATLSPKTFTSLVTQVLSIYNTSSGATIAPNMNRIMAIMFHHVNANMIVTAKKVLGKERVTNEKVTMNLSVSKNDMQRIMALVNSSQETVTSSVYGQPKNQMSSGAIKWSHENDAK